MPCILCLGNTVGKKVKTIKGVGYECQCPHHQNDWNRSECEDVALIPGTEIEDSWLVTLAELGQYYTIKKNKAKYAKEYDPYQSDLNKIFYREDEMENEDIEFNSEKCTIKFGGDVDEWEMLNIYFTAKGHIILTKRAGIIARESADEFILAKKKPGMACPFDLEKTIVLPTLGADINKYLGAYAYAMHIQEYQDFAPVCYVNDTLIPESLVNIYINEEDSNIENSALQVALTIAKPRSWEGLLVDLNFKDMLNCEISPNFDLVTPEGICIRFYESENETDCGLRIEGHSIIEQWEKVYEVIAKYELFGFSGVVFKGADNEENFEIYRATKRVLSISSSKDSDPMLEFRLLEEYEYDKEPKVNEYSIRLSEAGEIKAFDNGSFGVFAKDKEIIIHPFKLTPLENGYL